MFLCVCIGVPVSVCECVCVCARALAVNWQVGTTLKQFDDVLNQMFWFGVVFSISKFKVVATFWVFVIVGSSGASFYTQLFKTLWKYANMTYLALCLQPAAKRGKLRAMFCWSDCMFARREERRSLEDTWQRDQSPLWHHQGLINQWAVCLH